MCMIIDTSSRETRSAFYGSGEWRRKRADILRRDNYECQWCKEEGRVITDKQQVILEVDHIKELEDHPELAFDDDNLRTLCKDCHNKRHKRMRYRRMNKKCRKSKWEGDERWD